MRIIFMGTPEFAVPTLRALVEAGHEVVAAYTQPPRPAGRGKQDRKSAVQAVAEYLGIAVRHPVSLKAADAQAEFAALNADIAVVAAYGLILPQAVLDAPRFGCVNVHASLLPRWRGAAPIQRAILAGDEETGVTIMRMEAGLDTGPMLASMSTPINTEFDTTGTLTEELAVLGSHLIVAVLSNLSRYPPVPQPAEGITYAAKVMKSEARLDFTKSADQVTRQAHAFNPLPGAYFEFKGERIRILDAEADDEETGALAGTVIDDRLKIACGSGAVIPVGVQRAGKPAMNVEDMLRGFPIPAGTRLE